MANADVTRIINSDEVQAVVRPVKRSSKHTTAKKNPLKVSLADVDGSQKLCPDLDLHLTPRALPLKQNLNALIKLNPYAQTQKRQATLFQQARLAAKAKSAAKSA